MRKLYIDVKHGSDISGDGSAASPFKSLSFIVPQLIHGDEVIINSVFEDDEFIFEEPDTLELIDLINVTIRFLTKDNEAHSNTVWRPTTVGSRNATIYMQGCSNVRIEGANFISTIPLVNHAHAIKIVNSSNIDIAACNIHKDWEVDGIENGEMFAAEISNVTFSSNTMSGVNNSYSNVLAFISVDGNGDYAAYSNSVTDITSNNGTVKGMWIKKETRKVTVDGFLAHNIEADLMDRSIGIHIESDRSAVNFLINSAQLSHLHIGIKVNDIPLSSNTHRIKHCTFYKCRKGVVAENCELLDIYSSSFYAGGQVIEHEYPPGHMQRYQTFAIWAGDQSSVHVLNSIITDTYCVAYAQQNSLIDMDHIVWNKCNDLKITETKGNVTALQYIRRIDPKYEDINLDPWGYFLLDDQSPCIDSGKKYGDQFLGLGPDIGALERSRKLRVSDLPALLARSIRYTNKIPLTNIDIEGMIVRGLDTYDPEIKSGREGSALRDMAVKPLEGLLSPYTTELEAIRDGLSFSNIENLSEDAANALASNVFVTRKTGDVATGVIRIYFENPIMAVIPAELEFVSSQALRFYTIQEVSITAEEMALNYDNGLYYVDVIAEAEEVGAEYNITAGSITGSTGTLPTTVSAVVNPNDFSGGANSETNQELKDRIETAITVRDLVTKKGITFVTPETFTFIRDIQPIGFRDPEMLRDVVLGHHIGGKVDTYIQTTNPVEDSRIIELAEEEILINMGSWGNVPILKVISIDILDPLTLDSIGLQVPENKWSLNVFDNKTRFSIYETLSINLHKDYVGSTLKVNYLWIPEMKALQDWMLNSDDRVVCADMFVKHFQPVFVDFHVVYYAKEEIENMEGLVQTFVYNVKNGHSLQESDIIDYCYSVGAVHVVNPFTIRANTYTVNGDIIVFESEDQIDIERISCYIPGEITVEYMGEDPKEADYV